MRVGICDFPSQYAFPPHGYGGIERWLWAVAVGAQRAGAEVWLLGPAWRSDLPSSFRRLPVRLENTSADGYAFDRLQRSNFDLLVVGHEYPSHPDWRRTWTRLDCDVATFQHDSRFVHLDDAFDGARSRLFCYSQEMADRYRKNRPIRALSVQFGLGEEEPPAATAGGDLIWLGRIDHEKAPHLAAEAARTLGRRIKIVGPVLDRHYFERHRAQLVAPHVKLIGELSGADKLKAIQQARTMVYTCARDYVEAGAAIFGESLRSGTAVAGVSWREGGCADAALCDLTGAVHRIDPATSDRAAAGELAEAISRTERLDATEVQAIGLERFDPAAHFRTLAAVSS